MLELTGTNILKLADNYVLYKLEIDKAMYWLFDIEEGTYFDLNKISYFELSLIDGKTSFAELSKKVIAEYNLDDPALITNDLREFTETLYNKGILTKA
jgi:hypothetical protein